MVLTMVTRLALSIVVTGVLWFALRYCGVLDWMDGCLLRDQPLYACEWSMKIDR